MIHLGIIIWIELWALGAHVRQLGKMGEDLCFKNRFSLKTRDRWILQMELTFDFRVPNFFP